MTSSLLPPHFRLNVLGHISGDLLFTGSWYQDVTLRHQQILCGCLGPREANNGAISLERKCVCVLCGVC